MKVPDKIYVHIKDNPPEITWSEVKAKGCINEEYIRKDALLEWAESKKKELFEMEITDVSAGMNGAFDLLINKLKSM